MAGKVYNCGVIGYGLSAKVFHIPLIEVTPQFKLHSIVQRKPKDGDDASKDHPDAKLYSDASEMFKDPAVDVIVVTTPPETHVPLTKAALESGKHVIVEKPFVPSVADAEILIKLSAETGKLICVYQNRRWDTDFLTAKKLIGDGLLGRVVEFETHFDRYKPDRPSTWKGNLTMANGGGVVYDLGTHLIDQAYVLFGMPKSVTGIFRNERDDGAEEPDAITILLEYGPSGPLVTVKAGVISVETEQLRYWIRGSKGSFKKHRLDVQEDQLKAGLKPGDHGFGVEDEKASGTIVEIDSNGTPTSRSLANIQPQTYATLYSEFARAIDGGGEAAVPVKASEARDVLKIIEAAKQSAKSGSNVTL